MSYVYLKFGRYDADSNDLTIDTIPLNVTSVGVSVQKTIPAFPIPFSGVVTGESLTAALKDARLAYNVYTDLLGSEGLVQEIMKGSRMKSSLIDVISSGYYRPEDLMVEGESLMDTLREQGLDARSYQLYQSYMKLINEQPMIPLD